jgi:hypothetical protein
LLGWLIITNINSEFLVFIFVLFQYIFLFFFGGLCLSVVLDPGNVLFGIKEHLFILSFITGAITIKRYPSLILIIYIIVGLLIPVYGLLVGNLLGDYFSVEYALMYLKAFMFLSLILIGHKYGLYISDIFSVITLLLIPITIVIWYMVDSFSVEQSEIYPQEIVVVSRRAFGPLLIDPVVFYKTSPLLVFGLSFLCFKKQSSLTLLLLILGFWVMFISGTRANLISVTVIYIIGIYNCVKANQRLKNLFILISIFLVFVFFPYLLTEVFFNSEESSLITKQSLIDSYLLYWNENPLKFLLGSGLGAGMATDVRGVEYIMEPTYFEIVRFWGIINMPFTVFFLLLLPICFFMKSQRSTLFPKYKYVFIAYLLYVFVEIPSNPLLLSSTGMIVYVIALSSSYYLYKYSHSHD